jgi:flagellum-specific peptidoglycan hydrolase FlgJ
MDEEFRPKRRYWYMRKTVLFFLLCASACVQVFFSCASNAPAGVPISHSRPKAESKKPDTRAEPKKPDTVSEAKPAENASLQSSPPVAERMEPAAESPERPDPALPDRRPAALDRPLLGRGRVEAEKLAAFLLAINTDADNEFVEQLARLYVEEAALEGVDHDVAFAQMCLETGFLRYGGLVTYDMNNFCGLGAIGPGRTGERFSTPQLGVRAQIQHLKGYATSDPLNQELVDPRYKYVNHGSAPTIEKLSGSWATDRNYAEKIADILRRIYDSSNIVADRL